VSELLTVSEVARILRVDDTTVRRWVKNGSLEAVVLPHVNSRQAYRIKRETLNRVLGAQLAEDETNDQSEATV
jgi:excisionase family DNA binding protein